MDNTLLRLTAEELDRLLRKYAPVDADAAKLQAMLAPYIQPALLEQVTQPIPEEQIPGDRLFDETRLSELPGLEGAYARFKVRLSGGPSPTYQLLKERLEARQSK